MSCSAGRDVLCIYVHVFMCVCVCMSMHAMLCVCVRVHVCARTCVCACVHDLVFVYPCVFCVCNCK